MEKLFRLDKLDSGDILSLSNVPNELQYINQGWIAVGDIILMLSDCDKLCHTFDVKLPPAIPTARFRVTDIEYKSVVHKMFKDFTREPIKKLWIEFLG